MQATCPEARPLRKLEGKVSLSESSSRPRKEPLAVSAPAGPRTSEVPTPLALMVFIVVIHRPPQTESKHKHAKPRKPQWCLSWLSIDHLKQKNKHQTISIFLQRSKPSCSLASFNHVPSGKQARMTLQHPKPSWCLRWLSMYHPSHKHKLG